MSQPLVAFCVPTYNHGKYLPQCLDSILAQNWANLEIWIGDDCSTDETPRIVESYMRSHDTIHYIRNTSTLGRNRNCEQLFRACSADFVARLDADDFVNPDHTPKLMSGLLRFPAAGYAHSAIQAVDESSRPLFVRKLIRFTPFHKAEKSLMDLSSGLKMCANMPIFRRSALEGIEFNVDAPSSAEDYYTACRMAEAGWGNYYSRAILGNYRMGLNTQWTVKRNILDAKGLHEVYAVLEGAYTKRGWSRARISRSRRQSATNLARNTFGRRGITPEMEEEAQKALHRLWPEIADYKTYVKEHPPGWAEWRGARLTKLKKMIKAALPI